MIAATSHSETAFQHKAAEHMAYLVSLMPGFLQSLNWSREKILKTQHESLRRLIGHAKQYSAWYRERLAGIDPALATPDDLKRIPPMTKKDLMEHWDEIVCVPGVTLAEAEAFLKDFAGSAYFRDNHFLLTSGGSSGLTGIFLYDWHGWAVNRGSVSRSMVPIMQKYGRPSSLRHASASANAPTHFSALMTKTFSPADNPMVRLPISLPVGRIVSGLNEAQPQFLHCFSSYLSVLCHEARQGRLKIDPKIIFCTSEPLLDPDWQMARETWDAAVLSCWSASETSGTFPCTARNAFHVAEDVNFIEPVDDAGCPVPRGTLSSKVFITNLYNLAMPLIRYEIEDMFELLEGPCGCGSNYTAIKRVHGRAYDVFIYGDRAAVHPEVLESPILHLPKIIEYQLRQTSCGVDVDIVSAETINENKISQDIRELLITLGLSDPQVNVRQVPELERTANGKLKRYKALPRG